MGQRFAIGQKVTPNTKRWEVVFGVMGAKDFPVFGKVYTVARYPLLDRVGYFAGMMALEEMPKDKLYHQDKFDPLVEDSVLEEELMEIGFDATVNKAHLIDG